MSLEARKIRLVLALREAGIDNTAVLSAMERVPREKFIPEIFADRAYEDTTLPIGDGQTITRPLVVAQMTQALNPDRRCKILEIGTGSGYQTAILAMLSRRVYTIERIAALSKAAEKRLIGLNLYNFTSQPGDGARGWPEQAPFDRIIVTAAADAIPEGLLDQLAVGGIMVVPVGARHGVQRLMRIIRTDAAYETEVLDETRFVPLISEIGKDRRLPDPG